MKGRKYGLSNVVFTKNKGKLLSCNSQIVIILTMIGNKDWLLVIGDQGLGNSFDIGVGD